MSRFLIIIERSESNYSAYVPDLPGCIATGETLEELKENMRQAITMHIEGIVEDQGVLPQPQTTAEYVEVPPPHSAA